MNKITRIWPENAADNPDNVLDMAKEQLEDVLVLGWNKEGVLEYWMSKGLTSKRESLWLLELFKHNLIGGIYDN